MHYLPEGYEMHYLPESLPVPPETVAVLVPTRGRPDRLGGLLTEIARTATLEELHVIVGVCRDDTHRSSYMDAVARRSLMRPDGLGRLSVITLLFPPPPGGHRGFVYPLNWLADRVPHVAAHAVLGDDHRPRTLGWDARLKASLGEAPSFAYGRDLIHDQALPTSVMMSGSVYRTLGFIAPPSLGHLFVDNTWKAWGQSLDRLTYRPDVVIEHMHPLVAKAPDDDTYAAVRAGEERDTAAWLAYSQQTVQPAWTKPEFGELPKTPLELDVASLRGWQP